MKAYRRRLIVVMTIVFNLFIRINYAQGYQTDAIQTKSDFQWPEGKEMGLSLSFDDARVSQIDNGIPLLDQYGVKATFYVSFGNMLKRMDGWKSAVKRTRSCGSSGAALYR